MPKLRDILLVLTINCEHSSRLIGEAHDRPLTRCERAAAKFHRVYCRWCRRYHAQLALIQAAIAQQRFAPKMSEHGRARIEDALRNLTQAPPG